MDEKNRTLNLICIGCPLGCELTVELEGEKVVKVEGNTCKRGEIYAKKEVTNPTRILTTTMKVDHGEVPVVSVKTQSDIPKDKARECADALKDIVLVAPVHIGDVVVENICGTGINIVATKTIEKK